MGRLEEIELENFKSYGGIHRIGPLENFSCIIGPNGSGKSNLMDAISFVLGVQSRQLRSSNLKEMIFRKDENSNPAQRASVSLIYRMSAEEIQAASAAATTKFRGNDRLVFKRIIDGTSGTSRCRFQDRDVSYEEYVAELKRIGVLVKARNFLVFQGDVESIAAKSPMELTKWIEHISESETLVADYERLMKERSEAQEKMVFAVQKRKMFVNQCREVKEQKDEADLFQRRQMELKSLKADHVLWRLWVYLRNYSKHQSVIQQKEKHLTAMESEAAQYTEQINEIKRLLSADGLTTTAEKRLQALRQENSKIKGKTNTINAKIKAVQKRVDDVVKDQAKVVADDADQAAARQSLEAKAATVATEVQQKVLDLDNLTSSQQLMSAAQQKHFNELKEQAATRTLREKTELITVQSEVHSLEQEMKIANRSRQQLEDDALFQEKTNVELVEKLDRLDIDLREVQRAIAATETEKSTIQDRASRNAEVNNRVNRELNEIVEKLRNAGDDRRRSKHEQRISEAIENMQAIFPGVHGRLHQLCKPIQKQYSVAITVAGGKMMDAVVVDSSRTAAECIQYLKEMKVGVCSFIPLDNLREAAVPDRYRSFGASYKPCIDLVSCDDAIRPAVSFAFDRALVCDTLDNARKLCYQRGEQVKVVTLQGHVIHRSGSMTGGIARDTADIWEAREVEKLQRDKALLEKQLAEAQDGGELREALYEIESRYRQLQTRRDVLFTQRDVAQQRRTQIESYLATKRKDLTAAQASIATLTGNLQRVLAEAERLKQLIATAEEGIFRDFAREIGVPIIRLSDEGISARSDALRSEVQKLKVTEAEIKGQIQYLSTRNFAETRARLQDEEANGREELRRLNTQLKELEARRKTVVTSLEREEDEFRVIEVRQQERKAKMQELSQAKNDLETKRKSASVKIAAEENACERIVNSVRDAIKTTADELPTTDDFEEASRDLSFITEDILRASDDSEVFINVGDIESRLPAGDEARIRDHFEANVKNRTEQLSTMQPNLHAADKLQSLMEKVAECTNDLESTKDKFQAISSEFDDLKKNRKQLFEDCYNHIAASLSQIYKDLTKSSKHPMGGNASLTLENLEEPYLGGIRFTAMPPMKRFRDMEQLSGGEKTVAALALLFGIHSFHPAPFFVLDEIDAALDNVNVNKICNYVRERTADIQCIVISLKDTFFSHADCLIGACRDASTNSTQILTLDLRKFAQDVSSIEMEETM